MRGSELLDKMNLIDVEFIEAADAGRVFSVDPSLDFGVENFKVIDMASRKRKKTLILAAVLLVILLMGVCVAAVMNGSDLWIESPSKDPVKCVQDVIENQAKKDYAAKIEIESIVVDQDETQRVRENFIKGVIAERRGWSDQYLEEHFTVVKAVYHAEYDASLTTRSDGEVIQYFYLIRDIASGNWSIVDNSGNVNWSAGNMEVVEGNGVTAMTAYEKEIFIYLSKLFNDVYSTYYDGLHYEFSNYTEVISEDQCVAEFMWTMYFLGKPWDVGSDKDTEQIANFNLQVKVPIDEAGNLDMKNIVIMGDSSVKGSPVYNVPLEEYFPDQLAE